MRSISKNWIQLEEMIENIQQKPGIIILEAWLEKIKGLKYYNYDSFLNKSDYLCKK